MDLCYSRDHILDRFKEDDSEIEELSRIEESELLQSPKFKRMQSSSPQGSSSSSPSKSTTKETSQLFDSIPKLRYKPSNQLLQTPTKQNPKRSTSIHKSPLKPLNRQLNFTPVKPFRIKRDESSRVSLTPAQRLEKRPGKLLTTSDILSCYEFKETVGRGAFANVYRAINKTTKVEVAIKEIFIEDNDDILELMSEIDLLKILRHDNIVKYHGFIRNEKKLLIFLEYCAGGSLRTLYKKSGPLPEDRLIGFLKQVLHGLIYLHEQGVVHRDVKAANILLTAKGDVKLTDFGVSTKVSNNTIKTFSIAGTPNWMAPEIISMDGTSTASDIWSLGATIVELLSGEPLYAHLNEMAALHAIVTDDFPPIPQNISEDCRDFLMKCFEKQPSKRITAKELLKHKWLAVKHGSTRDDKIAVFHTEKTKNSPRDFNSIKRFNTKKFLPLDVGTFKHTNLDSFVDNELALELKDIDLKPKKASQNSVNMFGSIVMHKKHQSFEKLKEQLFTDPSSLRTVREFNKALRDQKSGIPHDPDLLFSCLQWLDVKFNTDSQLSEEYLFMIREFLKAEETVVDFVDFSGFTLVSKLLHNRFGNPTRILAVNILQACFDADVSNVKSFIQSNGLKYALKMLQDNYSDNKDFSLFIVNIIYAVIYHDLIPWNRFQVILSNYPNFVDWLAVDLMQFVNSENHDAASKCLYIVQKIQGSTRFGIKPIFLNSIFKVYEKLNTSQRTIILRFISNLRIAELPENINLLRFLVRALKWETKDDTVDNSHLNEISAMLFRICHLNHTAQTEIIKLDALPTLQDLFNLTLPCTEYIIPLLCEFAFNSRLIPMIFETDNNMITNYVELLIDPVWQANALDSLLSLHEKVGDGKIAELLLHDEHNFLLNSFLVNDTLNYELYLERLVKFLGTYVNFIAVNEIRLKFLGDLIVMETIIRRTQRYNSDIVIQINLFKLLKILVLKNVEHDNYELIVNFILSSPKSKTLMVEQLKDEILQMDKSKENSLMRPPAPKLEHKIVF